jgi:branched-subunit amino acid aminotransferase/4-amino-4-deoxychorismate lyase
VNDAGLVWGATVTDLCRTFRHQARSAIELTREVHELVARDAALLAPGADLALVLVATPGPIGFHAGRAGGPGDDAPTLLAYTFPLPFARYRRLVTDGARLVTPAIPHLPATHVPRQVKHRSRLFWWLAGKDAQDVDPHDGCVTETASANFLLVKEGVVVSAPRSRILNGVSWRVVEEVCRDLGIPFVEKEIRLDDCYEAEEALLTCTTFCLAPVATITARAPSGLRAAGAGLGRSRRAGLSPADHPRKRLTTSSGRRPPSTR